MKLSPPVPALPVRDVKVAQAYYRDTFGFKIEWFHEEGRIGGVSHGETAIFFRETEDEIHPAIFWIYAEDVDEAYAEMTSRGADIIAPIENTPWGLRQFTVRDLHGNQFDIHHDL